MSAIDPTSINRKMYVDFLETHVMPCLTEDFLSSIHKSDVLEFLAGKTVPGFELSTDAGDALRKNTDLVMAFVRMTGIENLLFTKEGAWYVPPKMRETWPDYKGYLLSDFNEGRPAGLAAIVCARNEPIPAFMDDVGGFEIGDYHTFLSIIDLSTKTSVELHQTFMEDSNRYAFRPGIVGVNMRMAEELYQGKITGYADEAANFSDAISYANFLIKDPETNLDKVGMLKKPVGGLVSYQCEMIGDPTHASNWDGETPGSNFNYIPILAIPFELTQLQLSVLLADRLMAIAECKKVPAVNSPTQDQNENGFIPATLPAFFPDGTPRYVRTITEKTSDGDEVTYINAVDNSNGAIRVELFLMAVPDGDKRQVIIPYNHYGNVAGYGHPDAANCMGAVVSVMKGIAAGGCIDKSPLHLFGDSVFRVNSFAQCVIQKIGDTIPREIHLQGRYCGKVNVYTLNTDSKPIRIIDFCDIMEMADNASASFSLKKTTPRGFTGENAEIVINARKKTVNDKMRPDAKELLLFPTGTVGTLLLTVAHHCDEIDG